ncbi:RimK family alpha-L-glutamate ligase [uncultured Helicobacter sp.]|uniref:ATP-grasp domain-containing protein n=1 Tax=uncultured Helicobacter sp. TaxID=175537 RepID=UPI00374E9899
MLFNTLATNIYIIHENDEWIPPFAQAFERAGIKFGEIYLTQGGIDLDSPPPQGIFWSRLSASSHTRDHSLSKEYGRAVLSWLESYGRRVINGSSVLELEVSKVRQYLALNKAGFRTPKTIAVFGKNDLLECAKTLQAPFITKHNQGGKGLGVRRFESIEEFKEYIESGVFEPPIDGITLLQEYIRAKEFYITRIEFIGGKFHYAVRVDTSNGAFELCPADACDIERTKALPELAGGACDIGGVDKFSLRTDINSNTPLVQKLEGFLQTHNIAIAGVEFIESVDGEIVVYDINTNTNYNSKVESHLRGQNKQGAADRVVEFLHSELEKIQRSK